MEVGRLRAFVDGRWAAIREEVRAQIRASELLRPVDGLSIEDYRARVLEQARMVSQTKSARLFFPREYGGEGDMGGALTAFETIALVDLSLLVKVGVQYGLFGGVIRRLGTERHHQRYLRAAMTMELPGFCGSYLMLAGSPSLQECMSTNWRSQVTSCEHSY